MAVSLDRLFEPDNLERIPVDKKVVVVCKSGARALAAGTAPRHVGFENVYVLKGGLKGLTAYLGAKQAY